MVNGVFSIPDEEDKTKDTCKQDISKEDNNEQLWSNQPIKIQSWHLARKLNTATSQGEVWSFFKGWESRLCTGLENENIIS